MYYDYNEIKEEVRKRVEPFRENYINFFDVFEEFYNPDSVKSIYIKNIFNNNETETIFFFENKLVIVSKKDLHYSIVENRNGVISKAICVSKQASREINLELTFEDGKKIIFNNFKDSNVDWAEDYGLDIKEIYKSI